MTFTWDWLLSNLISTGITDYYQVNVCLNRTDFLLYRLGRGRGPMVTEAHIIKRTSQHCYRLMSFDFDTVNCTSFQTVKALCDHIIREYIPHEFRRITPAESLRRLRARREMRSEGSGQKIIPLAGEKFVEKNSSERIEIEREFEIERTFHAQKRGRKGVR